MIKLFKNRNFATLFWGRTIANFGDSLYAIAAIWLVYELGGSTFYTGLAGFLTMAPHMLQFLIGPIVDRVSLKRLLVATQLIQFIFVLSIPLLHYIGVLNVTLLLIIMPILTCINQFIFPAQSAALPRIVETDDLVGANSLFSFANSGVNILANSIGGVLITIVGAINIYFFDAFLFLITIFIFLLFSYSEPTELKVNSGSKTLTSHTKRYFNDLFDGYKFVRGSIISKFFYGSVAANFSFGIALAVLPAYSSSRGGVELYGIFMGTYSAGYLCGVLLSPYLKRFNFGKMVITSFFISSLFWLSSVFVPSNILSIIIFGIALIPLGAAEVTMAAAGQRIMPQQYLARTFSLISSISFSAMPLGSLFGGYIGTVTNSHLAFAIGSLGMLFVSLAWVLIPQLRKLPKIDEIDPKKYFDNQNGTV
ncbi:MFS transporter [Sporosarcina sp. D27]|uniref:MFS transporter n=1 Tax=Sporosarcina sp. D27 TaxID=1382305 RepID=UPI0004B5C7A4|nr:MFS transporter [Sporosarcina sp. D27]